ncbi:TetR/AcrR family transcriptional regulator [Levilactobacillus zymae]|uniref:Transcriptional regulator, TetR family n=1 Tax=Levilactobacillus zymae TaxID=267363 RepID=A0A1Y6JW75_9LACO|nr:TetR/AcrR family transcriptional regulator [Levilactobacillus zymae]SMS14186.1 Transcriptional regulator, TetR family [Levilactobacillus zymae]
MNGQERLAEQSRQLLVGALFTLLADNHYGEITVTDLTTQAQLARRTFYRSFANKDDLLAFYGNRSLRRYQVVRREKLTATADLQTAMTFFFQFWWPERHRLRLLIQQNLFMGLLTQSRVTLTPQDLGLNPAATPYLTSFLIGGLWTTLNTWLAQATPEPPATVAQTLLRELPQLPTQS